MFYRSLQGRAVADDDTPTIKIPGDSEVPPQDVFWRLPLEIRTIIITLMPSIESVTSLRLTSRAFATIPLTSHVWKNLLFGLPWLWDLKLPAFTDAEVDWKSVYYDVSRNDKNAIMVTDDDCDLLKPLLGLYNRRRVWWVLERLQERHALGNEDRERKVVEERVVPLLLKEFHNRIKRASVSVGGALVVWGLRE